jgi:hypothetical protein
MARKHHAGQCTSSGVVSAAGEADALDASDVAALVDTADSDDEAAAAPARGDDSASTDGDAADESDEDALAYEAMVEDYLDNAYQSYLERHHARDANQVERTKRKRLEADCARLDISAVCEE